MEPSREAAERPAVGVGSAGPLPSFDGAQDRVGSLHTSESDKLPVADEVRRLTPYVRQHGLAWERLPAFIALRHELFEIDTRFGQLGDTSIFAALDRAGVLAHRVPGVGDVEHAMEHPPAGGRAHLRGRYVRELSGAEERYTCDWHGVWDHAASRMIDLGDPFASAADWQPSKSEEGQCAFLFNSLRRARQS